MSVEELLGLTATEATAALRRGDVSREEAFAAWRDRARADTTNSWTWVADEPPAPYEATGPLAGLPVGVKDLFCVAGTPTSSCSPILKGYRPPHTASVIEQLGRAGAPVLGKTNQDEFAMGSSNETSVYGPAKNPWDPGRIPGGSSGGSAAAVAGGSAPWALGTDTGGSVRQPAAMCGVVGLKPTYGTVSRWGMIAYASSLDQAGVVARTAQDAALLYRHMTGTMSSDPRDGTHVAHPGEIPVEFAAERLDGLRIGVPVELMAESADAGVRASVEAALVLAESLGAEVREIRLPHAHAALDAYYVIAPAEASANLARYDGVRYGNRAAGGGDGGAPSLDELFTRSRHEGFGPEVRKRIMLGAFALSAGHYDAYYRRAQQVRTKVVEDFREAFEGVDVVASPTSPTVAWPLGEKLDDPLAMWMADVCTIPMSLAGVPALSLPCGLSDGLPVGLQLAGAPYSEPRLLEVAHVLEQRLGFEPSWRRRPASATTAGSAS